MDMNGYNLYKSILSKVKDQNEQNLCK